MVSAPPPFVRATPAGLELRVKVVPGASRDALAGVLGERLKLRVAAPPEDGKANRAVLALLGRWLGRGDLRLTAGHGAAEKTVLVPGCAALTDHQRAEIP